MEFKNKIPQPSLSQISKIQSRHTNLIWKWPSLHTGMLFISLLIFEFKDRY